MASLLFSYTVELQSIGVQGKAEDTNKSSAKQRACQSFLKNLFPKGTTYKEMLEIIRNQAEDLQKIVSEKHLIN
jgi:hypothetical protein